MRNTDKKQEIEEKLREIASKGIDKDPHYFEIEGKKLCAVFISEQQAYMVKRLNGKYHTELGFFSLDGEPTEKKESKCSVFRNALENTAIDTYDLLQVIQVIKNEHEAQTIKLRALQGNEASEYKKKNFHALAFSGIFSPTRAKNNLQKHSNNLKAWLMRSLGFGHRYVSLIRSKKLQHFKGAIRCTIKFWLKFWLKTSQKQRTII